MKDRKGKGSERFVGVPFWVMNHPSFRAASHRSRALLLDVLLQYNGRNNGSLVICDKALKPLGWNSRDGLTKAKRELVELGLLVETRQGAKPNRAAWYALSWRQLDVKDGLDISVRSYVTLAAQKIEVRPPHGGLEPASIRPSHGQRVELARPHHGPMRANSDTPPRPPHGQYLEVAIPSAANEGVQHA
ncbi:hypothetical protein HHL24_17105 [Paraburkholderia sp. RP-4-7]|uniref:Uncharacterized protein n=1 Tax=Paraburkholderia polaris TaxID=2728848 RepID=A0A848IAZ6_9BURK|nr:hypothetical protein [Paraburkholderia polaris]NML99647.1 hypothetical protein [Paraburkholderia polaris]